MAREITFPTLFPRIYGVQYFGQGFIANSPLSSISSPYRPEVMSVGEKIYKDDTALIMESHFDFKKVALIRTFSSHKNSTNEKEITLFTKEPARIWIAYDEKGSSDKPSWLKEKFRRSGHRIKSNQGLEFQLYYLNMRKGKLILGGNAKGVSKPGENYFIIIENLRNENLVITRDVIDATVDELKYTSDNLIQLFSNNILVHNVWIDPKYKLYLQGNQFIQNGYSILNVLSANGLSLTPNTEDLTYYIVTNGPIITGDTFVFKYPELINGEIIIQERIDPVIIPAEVTEFQTSQIINETEIHNFEDTVNELNDGILPFVPQIEEFIPIPRQPGPEETFLWPLDEFGSPIQEWSQDPLNNPDIYIYGTDFINPGYKATIYWKSFRGSRILFNNKEEFDWVGFLDVNPETTKYWTFTIESDEELFTKNYNIQVKSQIKPNKLNLPLLTFHSDKKVVNKGDQITLSWTAENVSGVFLGETDVTSLNTKTIIINDNTEFILKGINADLTVELKLFIRIKD